MIRFLLFFFFILEKAAWSEKATSTLTYRSPGAFDWLTKVPHTLQEAWQEGLSRPSEPLLLWSGVFLSTALLYWTDEPLLKAIQKGGRALGLGNEDHTKTFLSLPGNSSMDLFRGPTDLGSAFYFLGDGWFHFGIGLSFTVTGHFQENPKSLQVGTQIFRGMLSSTLVNQLVKRSFGRESPLVKTHERGAWRPFPSPAVYARNTPRYDAMPSGHVMTMTMTLTILDRHYPEYRLWIRSAGITALSLLALQMMNNGVHWASDYPLGIAMGYFFGKASVESGKAASESTPHSTSAVAQSPSCIQLFPFQVQDSLSGERRYGIFAALPF